MTNLIFQLVFLIIITLVHNLIEQELYFELFLLQLEMMEATRGRKVASLTWDRTSIPGFTSWLRYRWTVATPFLAKMALSLHNNIMTLKK